MAAYSREQLDHYFEHIGFARPQQLVPSLELLSTLQRLQLVRVPFESLALHYSTTKFISLDLQDLFTKVVVQGRGGYCLENNAFFKGILQSSGFQVMSVVCRINNSSRGIFDGGWRGMSHMANIVTIDGERFLVDVGYGADGPSRPVPLVSDSVINGVPGQELRLVHKTLPQHSDPTQRVWIYSQKRQSGDWAEVYHFIDVEMFPADFGILNYHNMHRSSFAKHIVVQRFLPNELDPQMGLTGTLLLVRNTLKMVKDGDESIVELLDSEEQRIAALRKYFNIELNEEQRSAIRGRDSELLQTPS